MKLRQAYRLIFLVPVATAATSLVADIECGRGHIDRIIPLEAWGRRVMSDFTKESVMFVKKSGFTGVFLNGASGFGADQIPLALAAHSEVLPDLAPFTAEANKQELDRRAEILKAVDVDAWWCLWGVVGPDDSDQTTRSGPSNRLFDRRSKLEMRAKLIRSPELFGIRDPKSLSWRGSRPLCLSHPSVLKFYRAQTANVVARYGLKGMVFFPGDGDAECCDESCCRCRQSGSDGYGRMITLANHIFAVARGVSPGFSMYFVVWNSGHRRIDRYLQELDPEIGLAMSLSDGYSEVRAVKRMSYNQPWANCGECGGQFKNLLKKVEGTGRTVMAIGEIAQSEVWEPLRDIPNPRATLHFLRNVASFPRVRAMMDFWGASRPFRSSANLSALRAFVENPDANDEILLERAASLHYAIAHDDRTTLICALRAWSSFEKAEKSSSLVCWPQRFSYAIGREGARGHLYRALVPPVLKSLPRTWAYREIVSKARDVNHYFEVAKGDPERFRLAAKAFDGLGDKLESNGAPTSAEKARDEATGVRLAGELYASEARTVAAVRAFADDPEKLRWIIKDEIEARVRQLSLSASLPPGCGVNELLVEEDINNMRLYLSLDTFPEADSKLFHFSQSPYSE